MLPERHLAARRDAPTTNGATRRRLDAPPRPPAAADLPRRAPRTAPRPRRPSSPAAPSARSTWRRCSCACASSTGATDVELNESAAKRQRRRRQRPRRLGQPPANTGCPTGKFKFDVTVTFAPAEDRRGRRQAAQDAGPAGRRGMTLTDRDRKIAMVIVPLALVVGYWFLVLGPKRDEAAELGAQLERGRGEARRRAAQAAALEGSKNSYAKDYETVVRLGKAIPATLDMPSLLVQLDARREGHRHPLQQRPRRRPQRGAGAARAVTDGRRPGRRRRRRRREGLHGRRQGHRAGQRGREDLRLGQRRGRRRSGGTRGHPPPTARPRARPAWTACRSSSPSAAASSTSPTSSIAMKRFVRVANSNIQRAGPPDDHRQPHLQVRPRSR